MSAANFVSYVWFQLRTHHGLYADVLEKDEERDADRHIDLAKDKLTLTECVVALVIALTCVSMHAVFLGKIPSRLVIDALTVLAYVLVEEMEYIVEEHGVKDAFMGLILVPLVEKAAEHLTGKVTRVVSTYKRLKIPTI